MVHPLEGRLLGAPVVVPLQVMVLPLLAMALPLLFMELPQAMEEEDLRLPVETNHLPQEPTPNFGAGSLLSIPTRVG